MLVAVVCGPDTSPEWEWTKWLPHAQHPEVAGRRRTERMFYGSIREAISRRGTRCSEPGALLA